MNELEAICRDLKSALTAIETNAGITEGPVEYRRGYSDGQAELRNIASLALADFDQRLDAALNRDTA